MFIFATVPNNDVIYDAIAQHYGCSPAVAREFISQFSQEAQIPVDELLVLWWATYVPRKEG